MGCNASRYHFDDLDDSIHVLLAREEKRLAKQGKTGAFQYRPRTDNPNINSFTTTRPTTTGITTAMAVTVTVIEDDESVILSSSSSFDVAAEGDSTSRIVATTANPTPCQVVVIPMTGTSSPSHNDTIVKESYSFNIHGKQRDDLNRLLYHTARHNHTVDASDLELATSGASTAADSLEWESAIPARQANEAMGAATSEIAA